MDITFLSRYSQVSLTPTVWHTLQTALTEYMIATWRTGKARSRGGRGGGGGGGGSRLSDMARTLSAGHWWRRSNEKVRTKRKREGRSEELEKIAYCKKQY